MSDIEYEQTLRSIIRLRGHEIAKLQERLHHQRRANRVLRQAILDAAKTELESDSIITEAHAVLQSAKEQMQRMIAHNQVIREENTRLKDRATELEILHKLSAQS